MDIHKPKPWHGWPEFLREIGTIVIGVLIALGGEQLVEMQHWRHVVHEARDALKDDEKQMLFWSGQREAQAPCLAREFRQLGDALDMAGETGRLKPLTYVAGPSRVSWSLRSYDGIVSGQALLHMPQAERARITAHNNLSTYIQRGREVEVHDWSVLHSLEGGGRKTTDAEVANLRGVLSEAILQFSLIRQGSREFADLIARTGLLTPTEVKAAWQSGAAQAGGRGGPCVPTHMSYRELELRRMETPLLAPPAWPPTPPNWPQQ
jgi:hypothetical protein